MLGKVLRLKNSKSLSVQKIAFLKLRKKWKLFFKKNKESLLTCFWDWVAQNALLAAYSWVYLIKVGLVHSSTRIKVLARRNKGCVTLRAHQNNGPSFPPWLSGILAWTSAPPLRKMNDKINSKSYCQKDNCSNWSNNVKRLLLWYFEWPIPVFVMFIRKITKSHK